MRLAAGRYRGLGAFLELFEGTVDIQVGGGLAKLVNKIYQRVEGLPAFAGLGAVGFRGG